MRNAAAGPFAFLFLAIAAGVQAQEMLEIGRIRIGYGRAAHQVGIDLGGDQSWRPLFFDVDREGRIHIPDFYKARIAVFDRSGNLVETKPCLEGISPRMNLFRLSPNGCYVTVGDGRLSVLRSDGSLRWSWQLGYGMIPRFAYVNEIGIFVGLPVGDARSLVFDYSHAEPIGRFGMGQGEEGIPMIASPDQGYFAVALGDMKKVPGFPAGAFQADAQAYLLRVDPAGRTTWHGTEDRTERFCLFSKEGILLRSASLGLSEGLPGSGFWTVVDEKSNIYKTVFSDDSMNIVVYRFP